MEVHQRKKGVDQNLSIHQAREEKLRVKYETFMSSIMLILGNSI